MTDFLNQSRHDRPPFVVHILTIIGFTGFAIPVSIIAMNEFGIIGLALAAFLGRQWTRLAGPGGSNLQARVARVSPNALEAPHPTGNASFDTYRNELMERLKTEHRNFEGFLDRLREAKDRSEFNTFMSDRERVQREARDILPT